MISTERLYYRDCYLREFEARVVDSADDGRRVYLDRTAFYPTSGGQPFDLGTLGGTAVREIVDEEDRIAHILDSPLKAAEVAGVIDWERRYDHMQQHTGQHLLSAVLAETYKIATVSFHLGAETCTIDVGSPAIDARTLEQVEERCARIVAEARPVQIGFEQSSEAVDLRKASERSGTLRVVSIQDLDRSACGGTHVRTTAEIGPVFTRRLEKIRGNTRIEFVCGERALRTARSDYRLLSGIGRTLSAPIENLPALVSAQTERMKTLEKSAQRLETELAKREGTELYHATAPEASGIRRATAQGAIDDATRVRAQAFAAGEKAVFLAVCEDPPSILLAASADSGVDAGARLKAAVSAAGGRGGGNRTLAQGSVPTLEALRSIVAELA